MKYIKTFEKFTPIIIKNKKPYKVKKNLSKSIQFLQRRIKSLRKRLDDQSMGNPKKGQRNRIDMNNDKNDKIQKLKNLQLNQLQQAEYLKNNQIKESNKNINNKKVYWLIPTDNRLEDSIVKLYKQYQINNNIIELISAALSNADDIKAYLKPKELIMIITVEFSINKLNTIKEPLFKAWPITDKSSLEKEGFIYVGKINLEDYEIDALKYNL